MKIKFDVITFLIDYTVDYIEHGRKNVMKEHIAIQCTNEECYDASYHYNISLDGTHAQCFICGNKLNDSVKIIQSILPDENLKYIDCMKMINQYIYDDTEKRIIVNDTEDKQTIFNTLWNSFDSIDTTNEAHFVYLDYLRDRGLDLSFCKEMDIRIGKKISKEANYRWRVISPYRDMKGEVVYFAARSISNKVEIKIKNCPVEQSTVGASDCLFGLYEALKLNKKYLLLTEGPFDVYNILQYKIPVCGLSKKIISDNQIKLLLNNVDKNTHLYISLDSDTTKSERQEILKVLSQYYNKISILNFDGVKDLGEFKKDNILDLKKTLTKSL